MGRLDEPDLVPAEKGRGPVIVPEGDPRPLVRFRHGGREECRVLEQQRSRDGAWLVHLAWGVSGTVMHGWYVFDLGKVEAP